MAGLPPHRVEGRALAALAREAAKKQREKSPGLGCAFGLFRQSHAAQLFRKQTKIEGFDEMQINAGVPGFGAFVGLAPARHGNQQNASQGRERNARATSYPVISAGRIGSKALDRMRFRELVRLAPRCAGSVLQGVSCIQMSGSLPYLNAARSAATAFPVPCSLAALQYR
ncbi:hypothetical protein D9M68_405170 [compost metagenome]